MRMHNATPHLINRHLLLDTAALEAMTGGMVLRFFEFQLPERRRIGT
jgi:hypothetical protein